MTPMGRSIPTLTIAASLVLAGLIGFATPASAQDSGVTFNFGAGPIVPSGDVGDNFDVGFTVPVGVGYRFTKNFEFQFEYMFADMNGPSARVPNLDPDNPGDVLLETNHTINSGTFNLVFRTPPDNRVGAYVIGGPGFYHRSVDLTTPDVGVISVCNPWWWVCYPVAVPVDRVIGSRSSTDFGFNVGGGVTFGNFFVEVRYHYVRGPEFDVPENLPGPGGPGGRTGRIRAKGSYLPINFGLRF